MAGQPEQPAAVLSHKLAPWLAEPLAQLERAHSTQRLAHGWLLTGPSGVGKINLALVFAHRLLTSAGAEPETLSAVEGLAAYRARHEPADHHPDLHWVFPADDKQSIGVDQVREISRLLALKGFSGPAKIVVIEPAEAMTSAAANALLKTLEEPTPDTYLLLVSDRPGRLPATIRSRCQHLAVAPPAREAVAQWLGSQAPLPPESTGAVHAPLEHLDESDKNTFSEINALNKNLDLIYRGGLDPQALADRWLKCDVERILAALTAQIQHAIRARFRGRGSTSVTDPAPDVLHNTHTGLPLELLFDQLDSAEQLRDQLGRGTNVELAVRVLLSAFKPV